MKFWNILLLLVSAGLTACFNEQKSSDENNVALSGQESQVPAPEEKSNELTFGTLEDLTSDVSVNPVPYITPQCYTKSVDGEKEYNPCYVCHTQSRDPNYLNDIDVQTEFVFPEPGVKNYWNNLFKDRTGSIANISDSEIDSYVTQGNYFTASGKITLAEKMKDIPLEWDRNKNGQWDGYTPDAYFNFDGQGFDINPAGQMTGWRAYAYYPFPGTFMPTNGSTDDVLIRLPEAFRSIEPGTPDKETYVVNLAIVEAMMKKENIAIQPINEKKYMVDLNKNDQLDIAHEIVFDWDPLNGKMMSYVGQAKNELQAEKIHIAAGLMPEGTEFLHSVRYLDTSGDQVGMAPRMKELRYSRKNSWRNYYQLRTIVEKEMKERHDFPERTKVVTGNMETGLNVPHGWTYQGFIEDDAGQLRPQTYEETYFCVGCHGYTGASNDTVLSFYRKFNSSEYQQGWYHWMQKSFSGVADPKRDDGRGEFEYYLENNPTGNEFRTNDEVYSKFYNVDGSKNEAAFSVLKNDISYLLLPSQERARTLNKAYKVIVDEQSYTEGREIVIEPHKNIYQEVEANQPTGITKVLSHY